MQSKFQKADELSCALFLYGRKYNRPNDYTGKITVIETSYADVLKRINDKNTDYNRFAHIDFLNGTNLHYKNYGEEYIP